MKLNVLVSVGLAVAAQAVPTETRLTSSYWKQFDEIDRLLQNNTDDDDDDRIRDPEADLAPFVRVFQSMLFIGLFFVIIAFVYKFNLVPESVNDTCYSMRHCGKKGISRRDLLELTNREPTATK